jgi:enamine deaminase RidA (YjgF/YER057c/UK114 family)
MIERHLVPGQPKPFSHYCHVVRADRHVWVSGAVGTRKDGTVPDNTVSRSTVWTRACVMPGRRPRMSSRSRFS